MQSIIEQLPGFYVLKNADSTYSYANTKAAKLLGFASVDDIIGKTDFDLNCQASEYAHGFIQEDSLTLKHDNLKFISYFGYADNDWRTCYYEKSLVRDGEDNIIGISCYVTDITNSHFTNITRFLIKTDYQYQYEISKRQFSYIIKDNYIDDVKLSHRESECLFFIIRGKSSKAIAKILNISPKTVEYYLEQTKKKFNCLTKAELIEKALEQGYLNVIPRNLINNNLGSDQNQNI